MNALIPFQFENKEIRVVRDENGEPQFNAGDLCAALGFGNARQAVESHVDAEDVQKLDTLTAGGIQQTNHVNESGMYALILGATKAEAKRFKKWVTSEVLPSIRKTGSYSAPAALSPAEMFLQNAQLLVAIESRAAKMEQAQVALSARLDAVADTAALKECPANAEPISHIRKRISKMYGLPVHIIDTAMRQLPYGPKPAGMVINAHEGAQGSHYAVFWTKDVTAVFKRFVSECQRETSSKVTHPFIECRFKLNDGMECR